MRLPGISGHGCGLPDRLDMQPRGELGDVPARQVDHHLDAAGAPLVPHVPIAPGEERRRGLSEA